MRKREIIVSEIQCHRSDHGVKESKEDFAQEVGDDAVMKPSCICICTFSKYSIGEKEA